MLAGFYSIYHSFSFHFHHATWALMAALALDTLDGRIARLTKTTSAFGAQYDSMADLISFGFAPACLAHFWGFHTVFGECGWFIAFIYFACTAIRLARFNVLIDSEESRKFFKGMPGTIAAGIPVMTVMVYLRYFDDGPLKNTTGTIVYLIAVLLAALFMVSNIRFRTFKDVNFLKYGRLPVIAGVIVILTMLVFIFQITLLAGTIAYLIWGIVEGGVVHYMKKLKSRKSTNKGKMD
jgi:CDP-diacylglycerol--serine O-phosphatidyltransferase